MVDLVGTRVELRRAGGTFQGLCPFHDERTPSFSDQRGREALPLLRLRRGRRRFKFVQETEGVGFAGALEFLADRYGVELELAEEDPRGGRAARASASGCWSCSSARRPSTCGTCGSPRRPRTRASTCSAAGSTRARCASSASATRRARGTRCCWPRGAPASATASSWRPGLASRAQKEGRTYDRFRRRIMFPLCDARGRVLGFGARAMGADQQPKYLNSSDGAVYHKGRQLFGADIARAPAAKAGERRSSPRATPTSSRCTRPGCATPSG